MGLIKIQSLRVLLSISAAAQSELVVGCKGGYGAMAPPLSPRSSSKEREQSRGPQSTAAAVAHSAQRRKPQAAKSEC